MEDSAPVVVRVRPDVPALDRLFDYEIPAQWVADGRAAQVRVGTRVRVVLQGRRVGAWVVETGVTPPDGVKLSALQTLSGWGPSPAVLDLAAWVADQWVAPVTKVLRTASPARNVHRLPSAAVARRDIGAHPEWARKAFAVDGGAGAVVRIPPSGDRWPLVEAALVHGNPLFVLGSVRSAEVLVRRLQGLQLPVAHLPDHWARAQAGAAVVGTRTAVLGPGRDIGSVVVFDEHDEALAEERSPTWHARDVARERARRLGVPCVMTSPTPSVEALSMLPLVTVSRAEEHAGWAPIEVVDQREQPPGRTSLFSSRMVDEIRSGRRVACVLNRRGRARLLACGACGEVATCENCEAPVRLVDKTLECSRCGEERPQICSHCSATRMKNVRMGVTRAREELAALAGFAVAEVTADTWEGDSDANVAVGTEALLHRRRRWDTVVFLDFDQELRAIRQNAASQALGFLARAARTVGGRSGGGRVIVQTRDPDHVVLVAAMRADPALVSDHERELRRRMSWPPFGAQAVVSGTAAGEFISRLGTPAGVTVQGPDDERWLIRSADQPTLATALRNVNRPDGRLRIEINPPRL